jgi:hypothetical protein
MRGSLQNFNYQAQSVLSVYKRHLEQGNTEQLLKIRQANPDLSKDFTKLDQTVQTTGY